MRAKHFHHIKGWADGGMTVIKNGAVVCPTCHAILSHNEKIKKVDSVRSTRAKAKRTSKTKSAVKAKIKPRKKRAKKGRKSSGLNLFDLTIEKGSLLDI
jgi:uncharacterized Zn finger protein (UPF0148 family)